MSVHKTSSKSLQTKCSVAAKVYKLFVPLHQQETFAADILLLPLVGDEATDRYRITVSYTNTRLGEIPEMGWINFAIRISKFGSY